MTKSACAIRQLRMTSCASAVFVVVMREPARTRRISRMEWHQRRTMIDACDEATNSAADMLGRFFFSASASRAKESGREESWSFAIPHAYQLVHAENPPLHSFRTTRGPRKISALYSALTSHQSGTLACGGHFVPMRGTTQREDDVITTHEHYAERLLFAKGRRRSSAFFEG